MPENLQQFTVMRHDYNSYNQYFLILHWATPVESFDNYQMLVHVNKKPSQEHVRRYNGPHSSKIAAIIPASEDGFVSQQDNALRR